MDDRELQLPCPACDIGRVHLAGVFTRCVGCIVAGRQADCARHLAVIRAQADFQRGIRERRDSRKPR